MEQAAQQRQLGQQQIQRNAYEMQQLQAVNEAYRNALRVDENGQPTMDQDALSKALATSGHGSAIPAVLKGLNDYYESQAKVQKAHSENQVASQDAMGSLGYAIQQSKYDPNLASALIEQHLSVPGLPDAAKQQLTQMRGIIQQNPALVKTLADNYVLQSPKHRELAAQEMQAAARMKAAGKQPQGENPLTDVDSLNQGLAARYQVLNPGQSLPSYLTLKDGATQKDFDRIDKLLQQTEQAKGTKAQQDTVNAIRQQTASLAQSSKGEARADRSYQYSNNQLNSLQQPIEQLNGRMSRLEASLDQGTPQADALVAPELLTVMAGGMGSGLRMNEAEISRIMGGRNAWENLKSKIDRYQADPSKPFLITPEQRRQVRDLLSEVQKRVSTQSQIINDARDELNSTDDPAEHKQIVAGVRRKLSNISGAQGQSGGQVTVVAPDGSRHTFRDQASADKFKQLAGIK